MEIEGRAINLSNLDKVLWPATGTTKGDMVNYYAQIAPVLVPHLVGRAVTLKRFPDGVEKGSFYEKNCPSHKPPWVGTVKMGDVNYCLVEEAAAVVWLANLAAIELHPTLAAKPDLGSPTAVVFDLDPGAPADVLTCARVALLVRDVLERLHLEAWAKTSGSKGLQLYVPLNSGATYERSTPFAKAVAQLLEKRHPDLVLSYQLRAARAGKVLIDWSQNVASKTTVSVYSLRPAPNQRSRRRCAGTRSRTRSRRGTRPASRSSGPRCSTVPGTGATSWPMSSPASKSSQSCDLEGRAKGAGPLSGRPGPVPACGVADDGVGQRRPGRLGPRPEIFPAEAGQGDSGLGVHPEQRA